METKQRATPHLYGRRKGRPLRVRKSWLMQDILPRFLIAPPEGARVVPQAFFPDMKAKAAWLEIGFGGGEHLAEQARLHPEICLIGCEPFVNGVASLLDHLEKAGTQNVRVYNNDARLMCDALADASLDKCFVLFADPWPKKRHAERRFIGPENLDRLARLLKPGAILRVASDDANLVEWMRECLEAHADFDCVHASMEEPADWVKTRYQEKALLAGRRPFFMDYKRK